MKNIIRRINLVSIILLAILALKANVYAANDSFKTNLSVDNSQVQRENSITLTISLSDIAIESAENGIGAYSAKLDFDSSILEYSSSAGTDTWEAPFYQDKLIISSTNDGNVVKTSQSIGTITFKVKENASLGETTIKLTDFSGSTAVVDVPAEDSSVTITVVEKDGSEEGGNQGEDGEGDKQDENGNQNGNETDGNQSENENNENQNETENDGNQIENGNGENQNGGSQNQNNGSTNINDAPKDNIKEGTLPQAGDMDIAFAIIMNIIALISISLLVKINLINKKIKKNS